MGIGALATDKSKTETGKISKEECPMMGKLGKRMHHLGEDSSDE